MPSESIGGRKGGPPKAAVVVPCYNSGEYLSEAVKSALAQTYEPLEVVVVDDGSTDRHTLDELASVAALDRVHLVRQANQGLSAARNAGIRATDATYILPLDADDVIEPRYVAEAIDVLENNAEIGMVYCRADFIGGRTGEWRLSDFTWKRILVHNQIFCSMVYRRSDWELAGGYDPGFRHGREDHDFVLSMLSLGGVPHRLEGRYFHYRQTADGSSMNDEFGRSRQALIEASARLLRNHPQLYADHAEDLFAFIFGLHDQVNDLRHRYAVLERLRTRFPGAIRVLRHPLRSLRASGRTRR